MKTIALIVVFFVAITSAAMAQEADGCEAKVKCDNGAILTGKGVTPQDAVDDGACRCDLEERARFLGTVTYTCTGAPPRCS